MKSIASIIALVSLALLACPVIAAISVIPAGGTVFIGEQGLDITAGLGANTQIAWFPSTAQTTSTVPDKVIDVTATKTAFSVSPAEFSSRMGNWYSWASGLTAGTAPVAFRIDEPYIALKVQDVTAGLDVTSNKWIYRGDQALFRIETNLYPMGQRGAAAPVGGAPVTIKVQTPDGAILTALTNASGQSTSLLDIPVSTSPYSTVPAWDTGNSRYAAGTYTLWAECNANSMKDTYPAEGRAVSSRVTTLVTEFNPLIKAGTPAATTVSVRATTPSPTKTVVTTLPGTAPVTETTPELTITVQETATVPQTPVPLPTRTYADGFTAMVSLAACCGAVAILLSRSR